MNTARSCGCKGVRTCLECEKCFQIEKTKTEEDLKCLEAWSWCIKCKKMYPGWDTRQIQADHPKHPLETSLTLTGIVVEEQFLTPEEGKSTVKNLDALPWCISQSGRRKQNYGPKTNFKKRKLQNGNFHGFPETTKYIQEKFANYKLLSDFRTIEQCSLEYDPKKGASIDPHIDDCWIWGERVVTVNCLGDSVLTLAVYKNVMEKSLQDINKYNLDVVPSYENKLMKPMLAKEHLQNFYGKVIRIPMPSLSLIVLYGPARYQFEHSVLREDINERRVCLAYREFTPTYLQNGESYDKGAEVIINARNYW